MPLLFKIILIGCLLWVVGSLFSALYFLVKDPADSTRVVRSLTWRISISLAAMALLLVGIKAGWIMPHVVGG